VAPHRAPDAVRDVAARGRRCGKLERREPTLATQRDDEVEIFHDRYLRDAANVGQHRSAHEQRLVAVRQSQHGHPQPRAPFDETQCCGSAVATIESESERATDYPRIL